MLLAGEDMPLPYSDLEITQNGRRVRIMHPDSNWGLMLSYENFQYEAIPMTSFEDFSSFSKFKKNVNPKNILIIKYYNNNSIIKEKYSLIDEGIISNLNNITDTNNFEKDINIPIKKKKPATDDPHSSFYMSGDYPSKNSLKKPKREGRLHFDFKEIPSDILT